MRVASNLRAILAAHVALQFVDGRRLRPAHDVQRCLMRVTAEAADLEIEISGVQSVAEGRRGLSRSFESEHALVPGDTRQTVSVLPSLGRALRRMSNRTAVNAFARFGAHQGKNAPARRRSASRYGWARDRIWPLPIVDVDKSAEIGGLIFEGLAWRSHERRLRSRFDPHRTGFFRFRDRTRHIFRRRIHRAPVVRCRLSAAMSLFLTAFSLADGLRRCRKWRTT